MYDINVIFNLLEAKECRKHELVLTSSKLPFPYLIGKVKTLSTVNANKHNIFTSNDLLLVIYASYLTQTYITASKQEHERLVEDAKARPPLIYYPKNGGPLLF